MPHECKHIWENMSVTITGIVEDGGGCQSEEGEERWSERTDWAVWSAVRKAVSPYCWELWTPNALSETKTAINYSTGTEWTSYREEDMGGEENWREKGDRRNISCMGVRHKGFIYSFCAQKCATLCVHWWCSRHCLTIASATVKKDETLSLMSVCWQLCAGLHQSATTLTPSGSVNVVANRGQHGKDFMLTVARC